MTELASKWKRRAPCLLPVHSAAIDFHGTLKLCCHIYDTAAPEAAPYLAAC
jgi:hypothetical protein